LIDLKKLKILSRELSLLYVEDDKTLRDETYKLMSQLFKTVHLAEDGEDGLTLYKQFFLDTGNYYNIVLSDIKMPKLDGIGLSRAIFDINSEQKIIVVSAHSEKDYLVNLINIGVNAFIEKPFSDNIFEVLYKMCSTFQNESSINLGDGYCYSSFRKVILFNDEEIMLSDNEIKFLELLLNNSNQSFMAEDIFNHLYYDNVEKEFSSDSIKSLVKRLRKKIPKNLILNSYQSGYRLNLR